MITISKYCYTTCNFSVIPNKNFYFQKYLTMADSNLMDRPPPLFSSSSSSSDITDSWFEPDDVPYNNPDIDSGYLNNNLDNEDLG